MIHLLEIVLRDCFLQKASSIVIFIDSERMKTRKRSVHLMTRLKMSSVKTSSLAMSLQYIVTLSTMSIWVIGNIFVISRTSHIFITTLSLLLTSSCCKNIYASPHIIKHSCHSKTAIIFYVNRVLSCLTTHSRGQQLTEVSQPSILYFYYG